MAERFLRERYGAEVQDHHVYAIVSDGDLMEGIASEAASLAGQLGLGKLVYLYDDNDISLDGPTSLSFNREDVSKRFEAYGWHVSAGRRRQRPRRAGPGDRGRAGRDRPPVAHPREDDHRLARRPTSRARARRTASPLGEDEVRATKEALGWDPDKTFFVPDGVYARISARASAARRPTPSGTSASRPGATPTATARRSGTPPGTARRCRASPRRCRRSTGSKDKLATRAAGQKAMAAFDAVRADDGRRRRRPQRVHEDRVPRRRGRALHARQGRAQRLLRRARARHGRRGQRHGRATAGSCAPTARRSCSSPTTCAARSACRRCMGLRGRLGLHPRLRRASARTARPTSPSSTSRRCARSPASSSCAPATRTRRPRRGA